MPVPPPSIFLVGPATAAAAKAVVYEWGPAVSSASLAALLGRLAWRRLPDWIKEDVAWRSSSDNNVERLSTMWEKISAWMEHASNKIVACTPVPHLWAALLIYWQLCAQLDKQREQQQDPAETNVGNDEKESGCKTTEDETKTSHDSAAKNASATSRGARNRETERVVVDAKPDELLQLQQMLQLATLAYYVDDEPFLREQLETFHYDLCRCFIPHRPGFVGYYMAESMDDEDEDDTTTTTLLLGIRGTYSLEEVLTDSCGRSVSYHPGHHHRHAHHQNDLPLSSSNHTRIEVRARQDDWVVQQHTEDIGGNERLAYDSVVVVSDEQQQQNGDDSEQQEGECGGIEIISGHERIWMEHSDHYHGHDDKNGGGDDNNNKSSSSSRSSAHVQDDDDDSHDAVRCHEGIMMATQRLLKQVEPVIVQRVLEESNKKCRLILVGHSLGAGSACLLAMMLRWRHPQLLINCRTTNDKNHNFGGSDDPPCRTSQHARDDVNHRILQVYAFAPPPCLDHDSAIAAQQYVTTVVHRSDLIARCSLANLAVLLELLREISQRILVQHNMAPTGPAKTTALLRQLAAGDKGPPFWTLEQLADARARAEQTIQLRHANYLYVPGKLYYLDSHHHIQDNEQDAVSPSACGSDNDCSKNDNDGEEDNEKSTLLQQKNMNYSCTLMDVTAPTLRTIDMKGYDMLGDHTAAAYSNALDALVRIHAANACLK